MTTGLKRADAELWLGAVCLPLFPAVRRQAFLWYQSSYFKRYPPYQPPRPPFRFTLDPGGGRHHPMQVGHPTQCTTDRHPKPADSRSTNTECLRPEGPTK